MTNQKKWENVPFRMVTGTLTKDKIHTQLPFNIGAINRQGITHSNIGINNQDAVQLIIEDDFIIAVLCDGATNNHPNVVNAYSMNEVGAATIAFLVAQLCRENIAPRKNKMNREKFYNWLSLQLISRIKRIERTLRVPRPYLSEFRSNTMTTTISVFIVREKEYFSFHSGDGFIKTNNKMTLLENQYTSEKMESRKSNLFKEIAYGSTQELDSIALFSDGFKPDILNSSSMIQFINTNRKDKGLVNLAPDFHLKILEKIDPDLIHYWPKDDATMILLRKSK